LLCAVKPCCSGSIWWRAGGALQLGGGAVAPPWPTVEAGRGRPRGCQTVDAGKAEGGREREEEGGGAAGV